MSFKLLTLLCNILGKLFEVIFEENIKIIITTNIKLNDLYKDGLQREQFLPLFQLYNLYSKRIILNEIIENKIRK